MMERINTQFDQLLSPLEQLQTLCERLPNEEKKAILIKQIKSVKEQGEQAKQELGQLFNPTA